ncbi:hypothetical protein B7463_g4825, partial [Scytalidium lignicola]
MWIIVRVVIWYRLKGEQTICNADSKCEGNIWKKWRAWLISYERASLKFAHFKTMQPYDEFELCEVPVTEGRIFRPVGGARLLRDKQGNIYIGIPALVQRTPMEEGTSSSAQTIYTDEYPPLRVISFPENAFRPQRAMNEPDHEVESGPVDSRDDTSTMQQPSIAQDSRPFLPGTRVLITPHPDNPRNLPIVTVSPPKPFLISNSNSTTENSATSKEHRRVQQAQQGGTHPPNCSPNRKNLSPGGFLTVPPRNPKRSGWRPLTNTQKGTAIKSDSAAFNTNSSSSNQSPKKETPSTVPQTTAAYHDSRNITNVRSDAQNNAQQDTRHYHRHNNNNSEATTSQRHFISRKPLDNAQAQGESLSQNNNDNGNNRSPSEQRIHRHEDPWVIQGTFDGHRIGY